MGLLQLPLSKRSHRSGEPMVETVWNMISEWRPRALHLGVGKWSIPGRNPVDLGVSYFWPNPGKSCRIDMKNLKPDQKNTYLSAFPFPITM